ncbi:MAG: hypothetical protein HC857_11700 [Synechococcales cyanobacterium RU_4_20]|nr:hypothetical protein [Synechococcales cyanobacterium RU_4_20]NJR67451.1 hypothetical protein [Synechococcales cyanobacterium CRU_2_2]
MVLEMASGFKIIRFSDSRFNEITVEVQFREEQIAQLNKDKGIDKIEIELFTEFVEENFSPCFALDEFMAALREAKDILKNS